MAMANGVATRQCVYRDAGRDPCSRVTELALFRACAIVGASAFRMHILNLLSVAAVVPHEHALQLQSAYAGWCSTTWSEYGAPGRIAACIPCNGNSDCPPGKSCWSVAYCTLDSAWVNLPP